MVLSFAIGLGWNNLVKGDNWKYLAGFGLAHPRTRGWLWRGARWGVPFIWSGARVVAGDAAIIARAASTTRTAAVIGSGITLAAAVGVGYTVGAVTGTVIISEAEKRNIVYEGATKDVLDFYTGSEEAHYWKQGDKPTPGYFNIPGNIAYIAKHYWNQ